MMLATRSLSRAARSSATFSSLKNNVVFRNLVTAPRSNHISSSTRTAKNLNLRYKRSFSSSPPPPPKDSAEKVVHTIRKEAADSSTATTAETGSQSWFQKFLSPKEIPPRNTSKWYLEMLLICTVFGITGSSTMVLVRPAVENVLGLQGSIKDGPWSYRISSIVIMSPIYSVLLVLVGTVFGRHAYFRHFSVKMLSRFGIPPEMLDKTFHATKKTFRKW